MISPVQGAENSLTEIFFQKTFPEPKDEPLLLKKGNRADNDEAAGDNATQPGQASGVQAGFDISLSGAVASLSVTGNAAQASEASDSDTENGNKDTEDVYLSREGLRGISDELTRMKIRLQMGNSLDDDLTGQQFL